LAIKQYNVFFIGSCVSVPKGIHSQWQGSFDSEFHSDGIIQYWIIYNDGSMEGKCLT